MADKETNMTNFGYVLRSYMHDKRHSLSTLGKEIGLSKNTLYRVLEGECMEGRTIIKVMNWMFMDAPHD